MDFDLILEEVGDFGRFQKKNYLLLCLPVLFSAANSFAYVFTAGVPNYRCFVPECDDPIKPEYNQPWVHNVIPNQANGEDFFKPDKCLRYELPSNFSTDHAKCEKEMNNATAIKCDRWVFDNERTIVQEWEITCKENQWLLALVGTAHFAGIVIGSALAGVLADNFGRKKVFILSAQFMAITGILQALSPNYKFFVTFGLLNAIGTAGIFPLAFIIGVEMVGPSNREMAGIILNYFYAVGEAAVGVLAYMSRDYVTLQLLVSTPPLLFIVYSWLVPESVRWLLAKKDYTHARKIIEKVAKANGSPLPNYMMQSFEIKLAAYSGSDVEATGISDQLKTNEKTANNHELWRTFKEVLSSKIIVFRCLILFVIWATNAFVYYGLSLNATSLSGNKYVNFILACLIEIPGYSMSWIIMNKIGRRWALAASLLLCAFTSVAGGFVPQDRTGTIVTLFLMGKLGITSAFSTSYVHTAEMLPTVIRSIGVGTASTSARLGALVAPFVPLLNQIYKPLPLLLFGSVSLVAGILSLFLPETLGYKLPDTVEEAELIGTNIKETDLNIKTAVK